MAKKLLMFIANGSEEMEIVIIADVLVRAGVEVTLVAVDTKTSENVVCSRGLTIVPQHRICCAADVDAIEWSTYEAMFIPGGAQGAATLAENRVVLDKLVDFNNKGKLLSAVCAGSLVIKAAGIARGRKLTSHPSVKHLLEDDYAYTEDRVVTDGNLITSRAPGTCFELALALIEKLVDKNKVSEVSPGLLLK